MIAEEGPVADHRVVEARLRGVLASFAMMRTTTLRTVHRYSRGDEDGVGMEKRHA